MLICSQLAMCIYVYIYVLNSWLALLLAGQGNRDMEQLLAAIGGGILWLLQLKSTTRKKVKTWGNSPYLFDTKDHIWSATHHRQPNCTQSPESALFDSRWVCFPERLFHGNLLGLNFWTCVTGQCKYWILPFSSWNFFPVPKYSPFNCPLDNIPTNMPMMSIFQTLWWVVLRQVCIHVKQQGDSKPISKSLSPFTLKCWNSESQWSSTSLWKQKYQYNGFPVIYIYCGRPKMVTQIPPNKMIQIIHPIFQAVLYKASHH